MKKQYLALLFFFFLAINLYSQNKTNDISGVYSYNGGSYFIKPNGEFAILGYATFITGRWKIEDDGLVEFTPNYEKNKFVLYGRHSKDTSDSTRMMLSNGFYDDETFLQMGNLQGNKPMMKRLFKPGHRFISFPYVHKVKGIQEVINFAYYPTNRNHERTIKVEIYTIKNSEKYNDFIGVFYMPKEKYQPFYWQLKNNNLYAETGNTLSKFDLDIAYKEMEEEMRELIKASPVIATDEVFVSPKYNQVDVLKEDIRKDYKFISAINAWVDPLNYKKGEETDPNFDYNNTNVLFEYKKLKDFTVKSSDITIDEVPIFKSEY